MGELDLVYCRVERDGAVLCIRRRAEAFLGGRWEFPGGRVEPGESHEEAAVREVAEETGLSVRVVTERARHSWMDITGAQRRVHARIFDVEECRPQAVALNDEEHDRFVWSADPVGLGLAAHFLT